MIHIAGSKGKGTCAHLIAKGLELSGKRVGLFSSPWILDETEMAQVNGRPIDSMRWLKWKSERMQEGFSEFEAQTLAGFRFFEEEACDFTVVECGWGGARDATQLFAKKKTLTILTHVELEHTDVLGKDLKTITREKLGICESGLPLLTSSEQNDAVMEEIESLSEKLNFPMEYCPPIALGLHNPESVGLALRALYDLGLKVDKKLLESLEKLQIPGRMETVKWKKHLLILDGAHTKDSLAYVQKKVAEKAREFSDGKIIWAAHILKDKPDELLDLFPIANRIWIPLNEERARPVPENWKSSSLHEFFLNLDTVKEPSTVAFVGSFRLVAQLKSFLNSTSLKRPTPKPRALSTLLPGSSPTTK